MVLPQPFLSLTPIRGQTDIGTAVPISGYPQRAFELAHHKGPALVVRERRSEPRAFAVAVTPSGRERPPSTTCLSVRTAARRVAHVPVVASIAT